MTSRRQISSTLTSGRNSEASSVTYTERSGSSVAVGPIGPAGPPGPPGAAAATFTVPGNLIVGMGNARFYIWQALTIVGVITNVRVAPTGADVIIDVNKNGASVFAAPADRLTIKVNTTTDTADLDVDLVAGDFLTVDVDQIGSTVPGSDLVVQVVYQ